MPRARRPPAQTPAQQPQPPPRALPPGEVAAALGIAAGAAASAAPVVAGAVAEAQVVQATAKIVASLMAFFRRKRGDDAIWLADYLLHHYPERTRAEIDRLVRDEMLREAEFQAKALARLERDLPRALREPDREKRLARLNKILGREQRYVEMRAEAMRQRAAARAEYQDVKNASPQGGYWLLDPTKKTHTAGCLLMAQRGFWPWEVLDHIHPRLHAGCGCHLITLAEAQRRGLVPEGLVPDVKDAIVSARSIISRVTALEEAVTVEELETWQEYLIDSRDDPLEEASWSSNTKWSYRYKKGDPRGGQFAPKGAVSKIRTKVRKLLRTEVPTMPLQERGQKQGRHVWLRGRYVFVPRNREFNRKLDGVTFHSPAGSTNIYRGGTLVQIEGQPPPPHHQDLNPPKAADIRNIPSTPEYQPAHQLAHSPATDAEQDRVIGQVLDQHEIERLRISGRIDNALLGMKKATPPIEVGDSMPAAADALETHGFSMTAPLDKTGRTLPDGHTEMHTEFTHLQSGARLHLTYDWNQAQITDVEWFPGRDNWQKPAGPDSHPPRDWEEWADEVRGVAYRLADEHGTSPFVGEVYYVSRAENATLPPYRQRFDHAGTHSGADGKITLGEEAIDVLIPASRAKEKTASAMQMDDHERRSVWATYKLGVHEAIHAADPIPYGEYEGVGKALEEALTEELAHVEAAKLLRAHGLTDVLAWARMNPNDEKVHGSYAAFRVQLDQLLNEAGVAPELREDVLYDLKFHSRPDGARELTQHRIARLRDLLVAGPDPRFTDAVSADEHIVTVLGRGTEGGTAAGALDARRFVSILKPDLREFPTSDGVLWNGQRITTGTVITYETGRRKEWRDSKNRARSKWERVTHQAVVEEVAPALLQDYKFKLKLRDLDEGRTIRNVLDVNVRTVEGHMDRDRQDTSAAGIDLYGPNVLIDGKRATVGATVRPKVGAGVGPGREMEVVGHVIDEGHVDMLLLKDPLFTGLGASLPFQLHINDAEVIREGPEPQRIHVGDTIHYDGRADHGTSEAVVTDVQATSAWSIQSHQDAPRFVIEAITTENSLKPDTLVTLTSARMNGIQVVPEHQATVTNLTTVPAPQPLAIAASPGTSEPWRLAKDVYVGPFPVPADGLYGAEQTAHRERGGEWDASMRRALSLGKLPLDEAIVRGYHPSGHERQDEYVKDRGGWRPLPPVLYHVTTAKTAVLAHGLKSRAELGQERGLGLGGGDDASISFTADEKIARDIESGLREFHDVVSGKVTVADLVERARQGEKGSTPFLDEWARYDAGRERATLQPGELPIRLKLLAERRKLREGISDIPFGGYQNEETMRATLGADARGESTFEMKPGDTRIMSVSVPMSDEEYRNAMADSYKVFLAYREHAGGPSNPVFFLTDTAGLAAADPAEIATLEVRPRPGAQGYPMGGLGEWRTHAGDAVTVVGGESRRLPAPYDRMHQRWDNATEVSDPGTSKLRASDAEMERYRKVPIQQIPDDFWERMRADVRDEEGGGGQCGMVTEYRDHDRAGGWYVMPDNSYVEHYWFETPDGWIIDPTSDQFGPQAASVRRLAPGNAERDRYVYELPAGVEDDAGFVGPQEGFHPEFPQETHDPGTAEPFLGFQAGITAAVNERPERLTHGETGRNGFFLVDGKPYTWNDYNSIPRDARIRAVPVHSHSPDGIGSYDPATYFGPDYNEQPLNSTDMHIWIAGMKKGQMGPHQVMLYANGTADVISLTEDTNPKVLTYGAKRLRDTLGGPAGGNEGMRQRLREWSAEHGLDYREGLRWASPAEAARLRSLHPNESIQRTGRMETHDPGTLDETQKFTAQLKSGEQREIVMRPSEPGQTYLTHEGERTTHGTWLIGPPSRVFNFWDGKKLVGSLHYAMVFMGPPTDDGRSLGEAYIGKDVTGPYFFEGHDYSTGQPFMDGAYLLREIFIKPDYRGSGIFEQAMTQLLEPRLPVYAQFENEGLRQRFERDFPAVSRTELQARADRLNTSGGGTILDLWRNQETHDPGDYRGMHRAPAHDPGSSLDDPTSAFGGDDIYGPNAKHYYGSGGGDPMMEKADWESLAAIQAARGKPNKMVTVYRAVPRLQSNAEKIDDLEAGKRHVLKHGAVPPAKFGGWGDDSNKWYEWAHAEIARLRAEPEPELPDTSQITPGDWVTLSRSYAKQHGISNLGGYKDSRAYKIISRKVRAGDLFTDGDMWEWGWNPAQAAGGDPGTGPPAIVSARVSERIPIVDIEPTVFTDAFTGKAYKVYSFVADGGVGNPNGYVHGRGNVMKKDGTEGRAGSTSVSPVGGVPENVLAALRRVSGAQETHDPGTAPQIQPVSNVEEHPWAKNPRERVPLVYVPSRDMIYVGLGGSHHVMMRDALGLGENPKASAAAASQWEHDPTTRFYEASLITRSGVPGMKRGIHFEGHNVNDMVPSNVISAYARAYPGMPLYDGYGEQIGQETNDPGTKDSGEMLLWHGTPRADDVRAMGLIFTEDAVGHGDGPAIWLSDSRPHAEGYGEPVRVAAKFRKPLIVKHEGDSNWADDFEEALKREGVDVSKYPRTSADKLASPAVVARKEGFDAVVRRYPDTVYGPEVPEHLRVIPGHMIATAFDLSTLRVIAEPQETHDPGTVLPKMLDGLRAEARKAPSFDEFLADFVGQVKHGRYYHWTDDQNFQIDPLKGPTDMSSMSGGGMTPGALMVTSDVSAWAHYGGERVGYHPDAGPEMTGRKYLAVIDLSNVPRDAYKQVSRGFGNEFYVSDLTHARVEKVLPRKSGLTDERRHHAAVEQYANTPDKLRAIWEREHAVGAETHDPGTDSIPAGMERSWHLTDNPRFALDPKRVGQVNSTLGGEMSEPGIFVTKQPEFWFNRHDYVRPFVAEIEHPSGIGGGYYQNQDNYLPASLYAKSRIVRVIPVDEWVREHFHEPGWIEEWHGDVPEEFKLPRTPESSGDRYRLPESYRYTGADVRDMSPAEQQRHFDRVRDYIEQSERKFSMLRKYDDRGEVSPDFEKWVWPHEQVTDDPGTATLKGSGPLPMESGLYYRFHHKDATFSVADASSKPNIPAEVLSSTDSEVLKRIAQPVPGYSAFWNPHHLEAYVREMGWDNADDAKARRVIAFRGKPVGEGYDGEPLVIPDTGKVEHRMSLSKFSDRLEITPNGYGMWHEHFWGDGPNGYQTSERPAYLQKPEHVLDMERRTAQHETHDPGTPAAPVKVRMSPGLASEIDMIEGLDSVRTEEDIQYELSQWQHKPGVEGFIRKWVQARAAKRKDGSFDLALAPDEVKFLRDHVLDNAMDIWKDNAGAGYEAQKNTAFLRAARTLTGKLSQETHDPGTDRVPLDQAIYIAEGAMKRAGEDGGEMISLHGHPNHPTAEGRAESARLSKLAQEISGDPTLRVHISDWISGPMGDQGYGSYDRSSHVVAIRPVSDKLTFLHEIAHAITRTEHGVEGHTPEFAVVARDLYAKHISPEAAQRFWNLVGHRFEIHDPGTSEPRTGQPFQTTMYHGTSGERIAAIQREGLRPEQVEEHIWLTTREQEARHYAEDRAQAANLRAGRHSLLTTGRRGLVTATVNMPNPFVIDRSTMAKERDDDLLWKLVAPLGVERGDAFWVDAIRKAGYDGIVYRHPDRTDVEVFNPSAVTTVSAETFDPGTLDRAFYHVAPASDRAAIEREGLRASGDAFQHGVFVSAEPWGWAHLFGDGGFREGAVDEKLDVWRVEPSSLRVDEEGTAGVDFYEPGDVESSRLQRVATVRGAHALAQWQPADKPLDLESALSSGGLDSNSPVTRNEVAEQRLERELSARGIGRDQSGVLAVASTGDSSSDFGRAAINDRDSLVATHVTDDPQRVIDALQRGEPIADTRAEGLVGDLGASGLYVSDVPQLWTNRASNKWDFLDHLEPREVRALVAKLREKLQADKGYITQNEIDIGLRHLDSYESEATDPNIDARRLRLLGEAYILTLAGQPYNQPVWKREFLEPLGIAPGPEPVKVTVEFHGSYAVSHGAPLRASVVEALKAAGFDGALHRGGILDTAQLVIWNNAAIDRFGDWKNSLRESASTPPLATPLGGVGDGAVPRLPDGPVHALLHELGVPDYEQYRMASLLLVLPAEERYAYVHEWLSEVSPDLELEEMLGSGWKIAHNRAGSRLPSRGGPVFAPPVHAVHPPTLSSPGWQEDEHPRVGGGRFTFSHATDEQPVPPVPTRPMTANEKKLSAIASKAAGRPVRVSCETTGTGFAGGWYGRSEDGVDQVTLSGRACRDAVKGGGIGVQSLLHEVAHVRGMQHEPSYCTADRWALARLRIVLRKNWKLTAKQAQVRYQDAIDYLSNAHPECLPPGTKPR